MSAWENPDNRIVGSVGTGGVSRRGLLGAASVFAVVALTRAPARAAIVRADNAGLAPYGNGTIPAGIRSRVIDNVNGLSMHVLEAGLETPWPPLAVLLHGLPPHAYI